MMRSPEEIASLERTLTSLQHNKIEDSSVLKERHQRDKSQIFVIYCDAPYYREIRRWKTSIADERISL